MPPQIAPAEITRTEVTRVLILTSSSGNGHNSAAQAIATWLEILAPGQFVVKIERLLENSSKFYQGGVEFYNLIQRRAPWFHHIYYNILELQEVLFGSTVSVGRDYCVQLFNDFHPQIVVSVHDFLNKGYFELAKEVLGQQLRCITYCLEFQGGYGFSRNWVNPKADLFWAPTEETAQQAIAMGMPKERTLVLGNLLPPAFYQPPMEASEKAKYLTKLGLYPNRFTLLLGTGGAGAENHIPLLNCLVPLQELVQAIALCGNNSTALEKLGDWKVTHPDFQIVPLPFTDEMYQLLQVSSAIVTRPGGRTSCEALQACCPVIFNGLRGIMPQERLTVNYFKRKNVAQVLTRPQQIAELLTTWLEQPQIYEQLQTHLRRLPPQPNPRQIVSPVFNIGE